MEPKSPFLRPRCIGTARARTKMLLIIIIIIIIIIIQKVETGHTLHTLYCRTAELVYIPLNYSMYCIRLVKV